VSKNKKALGGKETKPSFSRRQPQLHESSLETNEVQF
jgi:hypothetical protein